LGFVSTQIPQMEWPRKGAKATAVAEPQPNFPRGEGRGMNGRGMRFEVPMFPSLAVHFLAHFRSAGIARRRFQTQPHSGKSSPSEDF
jgi:hypothetical protein